MSRNIMEQRADPQGGQLDFFYQPEVWGMTGMMALMFILSYWSRNRSAKTGILSSGQLAGIKERAHAEKKGLKRIQKRKHNEVALWVKHPVDLAFSINSLFITPDPNTLFFPNCESGLLALGDNGSGKSRSFLQPLLSSGLMQGFPACFFDIKYSTHKADDPAPCAEHGGLALQLGYSVPVFAPGLPESCRINPVELIRSPVDTEMAMQFSSVLYRNVIGKIESGNQFFTNGAIAGIAGFALIAKLTPYPDLLTVRELSNLKVEDFKKLLESPLIPESTKMVFDTLKQASDDAYGDLKATISTVLAKILMPAVIPSIMGKSTIDFDIDGKQLLIFGVDGERRDVVCPVIATIIHLLTNRNLLRGRKSPFLLWLDELPAIYLPEVDQWPNQYRSAGLVLAVGSQSPEMLENKYGKDGTKRILKGLNTQAIFQLGGIDDCKGYSSVIGDRDIVWNATGKSFGKNKSSSQNEQRQVRPVVEASEIAGFPQGKAAIFSRGFENEKRTRVPLVEQIEISDREFEMIAQWQKTWDEHLTRLKADQSLQPIGDQAFQIRRDSIQQFLRTPKELEKVSSDAKSILTIEERLGINPPTQARKLTHA